VAIFIILDFMERIRLIKGDITKSKVDVIVNAANSSLLSGGGVDGAIHRAGGPEILEACRKIRAAQGGCSTGEAVLTTAGNLSAKFVIHTVGPVWSGDDIERKEKELKNCYFNSLKLALKNNVSSIAFPNISTGIYRFPKSKAADLAIEAVEGFLLENPEIKEVQFVCFDDENYNLYLTKLKQTSS
jgi:O-acetyl-ADP-ribose deacetylase (regulator of RNase III)